MLGELVPLLRLSLHGFDVARPSMCPTHRMAVNPRVSVTRLLYAASFAGALQIRLREEGEKGETRVRRRSVARADGVNDLQVSSDHSEIVDELSDDPHEITGLLVVHEKSACHMIEGECMMTVPPLRVASIHRRPLHPPVRERPTCFAAPCDTVLAFMAKLKEKGCLGQLRVLMSTEDCPERYVREWSEHRVHHAAESVDIDAEDPCDASFEMYSTLLKIYERMSKYGDDDMMKSNAELVTSSERITAFSKSSKFMSLDEYLGFFHKPIHIELGSEKVWPIQSFMVGS